MVVNYKQQNPDLIVWVIFLYTICNYQKIFVYSPKIYIMSEKKFDLNKVLQAARLYAPVDYGYTPQFDIQTSQDNFNDTSNNVLSDIDRVGSGVRARKEEQEKRDNTP
jgi:hypothetical protein